MADLDPPGYRLGRPARRDWSADDYDGPPATAFDPFDERPARSPVRAPGGRHGTPEDRDEPPAERYASPAAPRRARHARHAVPDDDVEDSTAALPVVGPRVDPPADPPPRTPAAPPRPETADAAPRAPRAGRNLPAAIGVGLGLGAVVLASLFVWRPAFMLVVALALGVGTWEMARALGAVGARPAVTPLLGGGAVMLGLAWYGGVEAVTVGLVLTVLATMVWRLADGPPGYERDVTASTMIAVYVLFLGSFAALLLRPDDGALRVVVTLAAVVLSDTGGYAAGVLFGRHPMAPTVSPKKSWEGFAGSVLASAVGGALMLHYAFHVAWWSGALFGVALAVTATLGDLAESLLKRDLGIKDMGTLLPGHGGVMDRLDSLLVAAPVAYMLFTVLAPAAS